MSQTVCKQALPSDDSLIPATTAVTLCVLVDVHTTLCMLLSLRRAAAYLYFLVTKCKHSGMSVRQLCAVPFCLSRLQ